MRLCTRKPCLRQRWSNSIVMGVQEDPPDSWPVVKCKSKSKKKSVVLQVNRAVSCKEDPVFEATSKLNEKKVSLCCFDQVPQGTKMPLFQVPSWTFLLVSTTLQRVTHSTRIRTCSSNVVWRKTLSWPISSSLWSACYVFVTDHLQVLLLVRLTQSLTAILVRSMGWTPLPL